MNPRQKAKAEKKLKESKEIAVIKEKPKGSPPPEKEYDKQGKLDTWDKVSEQRLDVIDDLNSMRIGYKAWMEDKQEKKEFDTNEYLKALTTYGRMAMNVGDTMDNAARSSFFTPSIEQADNEEELMDQANRDAFARLNAEIGLTPDPTGGEE